MKWTIVRLLTALLVRPNGRRTIMYLLCCRLGSGPFVHFFFFCPKGIKPVLPYANHLNEDQKLSFS